VDNVRFAVVGLGMGMGKARSCTTTPGAELAAVCDLWEERALAARKEFGVDWVRDYEELLARSDIDVIGLWTPSGTHASMAIRALEAGKHVCTTKPMDLETAVCRRAIELADQKGLVLGVDFESRYRAPSHRIRAALRDGAIGEVLMADLRMKWYRAQGYYDGGMPAGWRSRLATERGSLANQAVHYLDLIQWWLGPVQRVAGRRGTRGHKIETEDTALAMIEFASGALGAVATTTCSVPDRGTSLEFSGTRGTLAWTDGEVTRFQAVRAGGAEAKAGADYASAFVKAEPEDLDIESYSIPPELPDGIVADMVGAVREGKPLQCDGGEGIKSVALFEAIYASSDSGRWVTLAAD
jgi:predicted dehydrogenase